MREKETDTEYLALGPCRAPSPWSLGPGVLWEHTPRGLVTCQNPWHRPVRSCRPQVAVAPIDPGEGALGIGVLQTIDKGLGEGPLGPNAHVHHSM